MEKYLIIILFAITSLFILLLNGKVKTENDFLEESVKIEEETISNESILEEIPQDEVEKDKIIHLLLTESNKIIEIPLEEYVEGVVLAEMPVEFEIEALKAQAIVARTYTLYKINHHSNAHENADICDDIQCCQAYKTKEYALLSWDDEEENSKWQKIEEAVKSTSGKIITYQSDVIEAFFHSHSAGQTEDVKYLWKEEEIPYLKSVLGMEQEAFLEEKSFSKSEFKELIQSEVPHYDIKNDSFQIVDYTSSGRVFHVKIGNKIIKATKLRTLLGLRSTKFEFVENEKMITFHTSGYGHGVGMSQYGANKMALDGNKAEQIILHYYTDVHIEKMDN